MTYLRYNIIDLKEKYPEKFGRFVMALKNLINSDDWGRICGIHGNTFNPNDAGVKCPTDPDTVTKIGETGEPFYCKHSVYAFIAWHTPYVYQFELLLNKHNKSSNTDYITLPWLDLTDFTVDFTFMNDPEITIFYDRKQITTENPLAGAYYYVDGKRERTTREGFLTPTNAKQRIQLNTVKKQLNDTLYATNYERFSSNPSKNPLGIIVNYVPLESPHNSLHDIIGGESGNMSSINISAFDPIFWLHHCNMDRHYYSWTYMKTDHFKNPLYPELMTDDTYHHPCAPFFKEYVYATDFRYYRWGWQNNTDKYMSVYDVLDLKRYPYRYDIIKPAPFVGTTSFVELIDIPIPRETIEFNVYLHLKDTFLNRDTNFAGSAVWFGINRETTDCCRCNTALTNIKIDIEEYVTENGITNENLDDYVMTLEGRGRLIKDANNKYKVYSLRDLIKDGSYAIVLKGKEVKQVIG